MSWRRILALFAISATAITGYAGGAAGAPAPNVAGTSTTTTPVSVAAMAGVYHYGYTHLSTQPVGSWGHLGGLIAGPPAVVTDALGQTWYFANGLNNKLYAEPAGSGTWSYLPISGYCVSPSATLTQPMPVPGRAGTQRLVALVCVDDVTYPGPEPRVLLGVSRSGQPPAFTVPAHVSGFGTWPVAPAIAMIGGHTYVYWLDAVNYQFSGAEVSTTTAPTSFIVSQFANITLAGMGSDTGGSAAYAAYELSPSAPVTVARSTDGLHWSTREVGGRAFAGSRFGLSVQSGGQEAAVYVEGTNHRLYVQQLHGPTMTPGGWQNLGGILDGRGVQALQLRG